MRAVCIADYPLAIARHEAVLAVLHAYSQVWATIQIGFDFPAATNNKNAVPSLSPRIKASSLAFLNLCEIA